MADTDDRPGPFWGIQELQRAEVWARNAQIPEGIRETILDALRSESIQRQVERDLVHNARWPQDPATLYRDQGPVQNAVNDSKEKTLIELEPFPDMPSIHVDRDTPAWGAAWNGLSQVIVQDKLGTGQDLAQVNRASGSYEDWQHMGASVAGSEMIHTFRHRDHPVTGNREYRDIVTPVLAHTPTLAPSDALSQSRDLWAKIGARVSTLGPSQDPMVTTYGVAPPRERVNDDLRIPDWPKTPESAEVEKFSQRIRKTFGF